MNIRKYIFKNITVGMCIISSIFVLISASVIIFIESKYIGNLNIDIAHLNRFYLIALGFAIISLVVEMIVLAQVVKSKFAKAEKIVNIACSKETKVPSTGIKEFDMMIAKIKSESKGITSRFNEIQDKSGGIIGVFEIDKAKKKAIINKELLKILDIEQFKQEGNSIAIQVNDFNDMIKNISKFAYPREENLFLIDLGKNKIWIKAYFSENDNITVGFFTDATKRMNEKAIDSGNKENNTFSKMFSREIFLKRVEKEITENPKAVGCFVTVELENLKMINDTYGYKIGDRYIEVAEKSMMELAPDCLFGKKSGYEFLIYFYDYVSKFEITEKLEKWSKVLEQMKFTAPDNREYKIKISAGYCFCPFDANSVEKLIRYSDYALYEAKTMFTGSLHAFSLEAYNRTAYIENKIAKTHEVLENNLINYAFQPIVNLKDGTIFGYEALMRVQDDDNMFKTPLEIIEIAKTENMLYNIERATVFNCFDVVLNNKDVFKNKRLFYNTIYNQTLSNEDVKMAMDKYSDIEHCLIPELPENVADNQFFKKASAIINNGSKVAIDNFTGKSGKLDNLFNLNPNYIKIDRSLIVDVNLKGESQSFITKLVKIAKEKGIITIAVGVEKYDELRTVMKLGVDLAQGFYLSRPNKELVTEIPFDIVGEIIEINNFI